MNNSTVKTIKILELVANSKKSLGVTEIARQLGYAQSSVFDIISALLSLNYIEYDDFDLKTYKIGLFAYQIGSSYIVNTNLYKITHPILNNIVSVCEETAYLAVPDNDHIVYIDKVETSYPIRSTCNIGSRNLMHATGLGKAILSCYTDEKIYDITKGRFEKRTENTITSYEILMKEIQNIRKQGYSVDNGEDIEFLRCIAAPVKDHTSNVVASISVSMISSYFESKKELIIRTVTDSAGVISKKLGYCKD